VSLRAKEKMKGRVTDRVSERVRVRISESECVRE